MVVSIVDYGASGGYWVALAADYIFALPGSMVGSMGVILQAPDLSRVKQKYGVGMDTYKAGVMKDMLNPWRKSSEREKIIINRMLSNVHRQFVDTLIIRRKIEPEKAKQLADGRIYTGEQAKKLNLVDALGGLSDAIAYAGKQGGIQGKPRVIYKEQSDFKSIFKRMQSQWQGTLFQTVMGQSLSYKLL